MSRASTWQFKNHRTHLNIYPNMGKQKMKLRSIFKETIPSSSSSSSPSPPSSSWLWVPCVNPKTPSFRAAKNADMVIFKTMNSAFCNTPEDDDVISEAIEDSDDEESMETFIQGLRSERLFFKPGETSSILEDITHTPPADDDEDGGGGDDEECVFKGSLVMTLDSTDPFLDFRKSMEEMVRAHDQFNGWDLLQELLTCYLRVNGQSNHGYIVGAFVDLLVDLASSSSSSSSSSSKSTPSHHQTCCCCSSSSTTTPYSFTSPLSFHNSSTSYDNTPPCLSSLLAKEVDDDIQKSVKNVSPPSSLLYHVSDPHVI